MKVYRDKDFSTLYQTSVTDLMRNPEYETQPRDLKIRENTNVALILEDPLSCLYSNEVRSSQKKYIAAELLWYFMGRNDVKFIKQYAKFWESIQNEDGTVNSSYGNLLFNKKNRFGHTQYFWALQSLVKDKDSRQAVIHFNLPEHQYETNKDFVCTMYGIFQIREDKLNFTVTMRSNDVIWGLPTDIAFFATLQCQMLSHLRVHYPNLMLGTYTHIANSFHIYEHHFLAVERMLEKEFVPQTIPGLVENFITQTGIPSDHLKTLFNNRHENYENVNDSLSRWIIKNLNEA
jgi:thymidylate synthase